VLGFEKLNKKLISDSFKWRGRLLGVSEGKW
jgi:hypothetical protein